MSKNAKVPKKRKVRTRVQQSNLQVTANPDGGASAKSKRLLTRGTATAEIVFSKNPVPSSEWIKGTNSSD